MPTPPRSIRDFVRHDYRHFNAAALRDAAEAYVTHVEGGGRMLLAMAGAMSTAELGITLAEMIRADKVHAICCTGANLEEDVFNLVAHEHYQRIPHFRNLTAADEKELERQGLNRVTDTCIPEAEAFRVIEEPMLALWRRAEERGERHFPHEFLYQLLREGWLEGRTQIDPAHSWMLAAAERDLPIFVPGWEDSTLGNVFVANVLRERLSSLHTVKGGLESMAALADWYARETMGKPVMEIPMVGEEVGHDDVALRAIPADQAENTIGFFQIGGGIAGDFPICVVPMIHQDMKRPCPYWSYFCQISDSTTSYGSYSGAIPSEKITWGKLDEQTPTFVIESDATIVAPLVFRYVLDT
ncbi:MAG: deoxyhypusine synthase family protein [Myxococcota bacterium]|nr:deoxyhypusine synthase family protein [Myxococcota bacterium]